MANSNRTENTLYTVGHSNHDMARFMELLRQHGITVMADVRSQPYSQFTPQFNRNVLEIALDKHKIRYIFMGDELGARRTERECYVAGKAKYDLIARLPAFQHGLERVRRGVQSHRVALLCSEKDPITCHRFILICRQLRSSNLRMQHILDNGSLESHEAAEDRLLKLLGLPMADLFHDKYDLVERAYNQQGDAIAYVEQTDPNQQARIYKEAQ